MMDCGGCLERLYAYLDQELSPTELVEVRQHLDACGPCVDEFVFEEHFLTQVRDHGTAGGAPLEVRDRIILRLRTPGPPPS